MRLFAELISGQNDPPMTTPLRCDKAQLLDRLRALSEEAEWFEFKENHQSPQKNGEYLSALANGARLMGQPAGFLVFGIQDRTHAVVGTRFQPNGVKGCGNEDLIPWLTRGLNPPVTLDVIQGQYQGAHVVIFEVQAATNQPVSFKGQAFVRIRSQQQPLARYPEVERRLWHMGEDWSAGICAQASYDDLDPEALAKARVEFKRKHSRQAGDVDSWDHRRFLTKARLAVEGELTNSAILLLGKEEAEPLIAPAQAWLRWNLKSQTGLDDNYEDYRTPLLLSVDRLLGRIRNLRVRYLPDGTLFPVEEDQYEPWVIRDALHNCIAHQDYAMRGRIVVTEQPDELNFTNCGVFLPGSVETVIRDDVPPRYYRNAWLCQAMVNLGMIDTQGGGIRRMFLEQKKRGFPLPLYDLSHPREVRVHVPGKLIDARYTRLLITNPELDLQVAMLLDRVQRGLQLSRPEYDLLRKHQLVEGRWRSYHLAAGVASSIGSKAEYIRQRGLDAKHYEELVLEYLRQFGEASREELNQLLYSKLPEILDERQKYHRIHNLLTSMKRRGRIVRCGNTRAARWKLDPSIG